MAAAAIAKIRIDIRHGDAFRIQETFEEEVETQRIDFRDMEKIGHDAPRRTTTARADGDAVGLGVVDEVHDNEEIVGEAHLIDDAQLIVQPFLLFPGGMGIALGDGPLAKLAEVGLRVLTYRHVKGRELVLAESKLHLTALGDLRRILHGSGVLAQDGLHFRTALAIKFLIGKAEMIRIVQRISCGNAKLDFLAPGVFLLGVVEIIGRHQPQAILLRQRRQDRPHLRFFRQAMVLQL